jgi:hypothetical protein
MAITYVDNINSLTCYPQYAGQTDVVFQCIWTKSGTDGTYNASYSAGCELTYTAGSPFTPYDQLTQAQVLAWVYAATPPEYIANMEAEIAKNIADQANPPTVTLPLPWNIPAPPPPDMSEPPAPATE